MKGLIQSLKGEKKFRMALRATRGGAVNFICGTAHFFPHRFGSSLRELIKPLAVILLEGPLDEGNMDEVRGKALDAAEGASLAEIVSEGTLREVARTMGAQRVGGGDTCSALAEMMGEGGVEALKKRLEGLKPWMGFFHLWSEFLKRRGWRYSVDLEALSVARGLGKRTVFLETIDEQVKALEEIPLERIIAFMEMADSWEKVAEQHRKRYLSGDLAGVLGAINHFPSRCASIVDNRDSVLFDRARPFLELGGAALFVGTTHLLGIRTMLEKDGYEVAPWEG